MDISAALTAHLAVLTNALAHPDVDLESELRIFADDVKRAVASYVAMTITIALDGHDVSFTIHDDRTIPPVTSLEIPLAAATPGQAASTVRLYAATPGAFVDLAADLSYALGIDPAVLVLDAHLPPPHTGSGIGGLDARFAIDQAVGVLIDRGYTPETARDELHRLASLDHGDLRAAAEALIRDVANGPTEQP